VDAPEASAVMTVEMLPVTNKATMKRFIRVPFLVHEHDKSWVPPLISEREEAFDPVKNELVRRSEVRFWIARRGGRDIGRISAQIDPLAQKDGSPRYGQFGCLSALDDPEVFAALFKTAEDFLRSRGVQRVQGPFTLSINEETGLLIDGFDTSPMMMMGHDPVYEAAHIETAGYKGEGDVFAYLIDLEQPLSKSARNMLERPLASSIRMRRLNLKDYDNEVRRIVSIFNDAWSENEGFVPMTEAETDELATRLKLLLDERLVWFAEHNGEPVAFIVCLPNINEAIRDLNGKLFPFGVVKLLWRLRVKGLKSARVPLMGVRKSLAGTVLGSALPLQLIGALWPDARKLGFRWVELSWILEKNRPMRSILERLGAEPYKTYRIYEKALG
jgi:GNAT superfamily N-acetyltransferase